MRWLRKLVIPGLAAVGAARVWELCRPRLEELRTKAQPNLRHAAESAAEAVESTAGAVAEAAGAGGGGRAPSAASSTPGGDAERPVASGSASGSSA